MSLVVLSPGIGAMKVTALACLAVALLPAAAQGTAAPKALNGQAPVQGKPMSRDELRVCLKDQQGLKERQVALETRRGEIQAEAEGVRKQKDVAQAERDAYQARVAGLQALKERLQAHAARVDAYNARFKAFNEAPPVGANAERERGQLEAEGDAVAKADAAIKAEATQRSAEQEQARVQLNAQVQAQQAAAAALNERNRLLGEEIKAYEDQRTDWQARCGGRPFREDDEKAIRAGH